MCVKSKRETHRKMNLFMLSWSELNVELVLSEGISSKFNSKTGLEIYLLYDVSQWEY